MDIYDLIAKYIELKYNSIGELRTNKFTILHSGNKIIRRYSDNTEDILVSWSDEYSGKLILQARINKFISESIKIIQIESIPNNSLFEMESA